RWPYYGKVIRDEVLSISVYNHSKVFSNRLLGKLVVSLQHVVTTGRLLLREPLTDIYIELDIRYHPVEGAAGSWEGLDFLRSLSLSLSFSQLTVTRPGQLEREARRLGRSLVKTGDEDEDDDDDDYDDDLMDLETSNIISTPLLRSGYLTVCLSLLCVQVNVNIHEAQKLIGVNINPAVFIRVGNQKKNTATQKSTNCPFYNENFQFEFQENPQILFDKVIEIKVVHRRTLAFLMTHIGTFKIDISTVYNQPDHRFYQKWAPLTDPADTRSGIKGYVKASLSVLMKGEALSISLPPSSSSGASEDIEKNLLLPRGMASERPWARFRVRIYKAEGLPTMESGLMAKMSKATERTVFIDPYVQVTFAGQQGETSVASATSCPVWNEEISFIEQFPPLAQRIRVQILDDAKMGDIALATHFLDLQQISDHTRNGFNPTFGPSWVNLSFQPTCYLKLTISLLQALNEGLGEGIFYRGRILLGLTVEVYSSPNAVATDTGSAAMGKVHPTSCFHDNAGVEVPEAVTVEVEETHPLPEGYLGEMEDFLLFASLFEVTMIDSSVGTRPLTFELSIGELCIYVLDKKSIYLSVCLSVLLSLRSFQCLPLQPPSVRQKPCLYIWCQFEDHIFRLYQANWLNKMADRLEIGLDEVERLLRRPRSKAKERLVEVLLELLASCKLKYVLRSDTFPSTTFSLQPQTTIPDVFLWLLTGRKRLAYVRIPTYSIIFSLVEEQRGRDSGRVTTLYMKVTSPGGSASEIFAKLEVYLWLGLSKYSKEAITCRPFSFSLSLSADSRYFQLRCHLYQGRGLLAADSDGLSDPFAKVLFSTQCQVTKVDAALPLVKWQLLGLTKYLEHSPYNLSRFASFSFYVCVQGAVKLLGRAFAEPEFKIVEQHYKKPPLRFYDINLGRAAAGELLAAFELIELDYSGFGEPRLPSSVDPQDLTYLEEQRYYIIPDGVRPVMKTFRIEVLFWGLRELKRVELFEVSRPFVKMECAGRQLESEEIENFKTHPNFKELVRYIDVKLPEQAYLHPPLTLFVVEHRAFGRLALVGSYVVQSLMDYAPPELGGEPDEEEEEPKPKGKSEERSSEGKIHRSTVYFEVGVFCLFISDLESEFSQFQDWLQIFPLYKGKACGEDDEEDEEERLMGKYKVWRMESCLSPVFVSNAALMFCCLSVCVLQATNLTPTDPNGKADPYLVVRVGQQSQDTKDRYIPKQLNPTFGEVFEFTVSFPLETDLVVRVLDHDLVGSDDVIGETRVDLENRFYSRHRATCGLALYYDTDGYNVWRDAKKPSAILGELCRKNGILSPEYRATEVKVLNKIFKIPPDRSPEEQAEMEEHAALSVLRRWGEMNEFLPGALPLVPEHVEIRSLQNQDNPGLPQGHVHMWVDMFPTDVPAPPAVDIKPRLPEQYELRVIIWNTDDVFLDDVNPFTGDPSSDIYVKGWIKGLEGQKQETDVHFNSLTGEGNFNWRFVFRFDYLPTEKEVVYKKKESFFSLEESEFRQPAVLTLQVWDYDRIAANDFLGSIELRLSDMVRGAKSSAKCTIEMAKDRAGPRLSIFRAKKMKGWWPLTRLKTAEDFEREEKEKEEAKKKGKKKKKKKDKRSKMKPEDIQYTDSSGNTFLLMGKVEAELQLVALEQAETNPVGRARKEPEPLDKPNRPTTSFTWFVNPMKTFIFLIWKKFKKFIIALLILGVLGVFLFLILYTLPGQISTLIIHG
uniref:Fer-1 like family member 4 n=1 Tax=Sparus aurata TaxID=8175 RepID=A0A671YFG7_SPAAU